MNDTSYGLGIIRASSAMLTAMYRREASSGLTCGQEWSFREEALALAPVFSPFLHCLREGHPGTLRGKAETEALWLQQPLPVPLDSHPLGSLTSSGPKSTGNF